MLTQNYSSSASVSSAPRQADNDTTIVSGHSDDMAGIDGIESKDKVMLCQSEKQRRECSGLIAPYRIFKYNIDHCLEIDTL